MFLYAVHFSCMYKDVIRMEIQSRAENKQPKSLFLDILRNSTDVNFITKVAEMKPI